MGDVLNIKGGIKMTKVVKCNECPSKNSCPMCGSEHTKDGCQVKEWV